MKDNFGLCFPRPASSSNLCGRVMHRDSSCLQTGFMRSSRTTFQVKEWFELCRDFPLKNGSFLHRDFSFWNTLVGCGDCRAEETGSSLSWMDSANRMRECVSVCGCTCKPTKGKTHATKWHISIATPSCAKTHTFAIKGCSGAHYGSLRCLRVHRCPGCPGLFQL